VEVATGYSGPTHGEAVAMGIVFATRLAHRLGKIEPPDAERIEGLLKAWGYSLSAPELEAEKIKQAFRFDKKRSGGAPRWVLPRGVGRAEWGQTVAEDAIDALLAEVQKR
jgi:3-dehydroquinate synthase